jgi:hypothetical protein
VAGCQDAVGNGGMCFVDPEVALNTKRTARKVALKPSGGRG